MELILKHNPELLSQLSKDDLDYIIRNILDQKNKEKREKEMEKKKKYIYNFVRNLTKFCCRQKYFGDEYSSSKQYCQLLSTGDIIKLKDYLEDFYKSNQNQDEKIVLIYDVITDNKTYDGRIEYYVDMDSLQLLNYYELVNKYPFINANNISKLDKQYHTGCSFAKLVNYQINNKYIVLNKKIYSQFNSRYEYKNIPLRIDFLYDKNSMNNKYSFLGKYECQLFDELFNIDGLIILNKGLLEYLLTIM